MWIREAREALHEMVDNTNINYYYYGNEDGCYYTTDKEKLLEMILQSPSKYFFYRITIERDGVYDGYGTILRVIIPGI